MLKLTIIAVGKMKEDHWREAQAEYLKRLRPYAKIEVVEVAAAPITATNGPVSSMKAEGGNILGRLSDQALAVALDRNGDSADSEALARWLKEEGSAGRHLCFIVGGAAGLDGEVLKRADKKISLSRLTFTHEMARIILLEQLYRAATIMAGKAYHY